MPLIKDLKVKTTNKFKKKSYRPWDTIADTNLQEEKIQFVDDNKIVLPSYDNDELNKIWRFLSNTKQIVLKYLTEISKEENDGLILSDVLIINEVANNLSLPVNTLKASLQNLREEKLIFNYETKPGRGGFTRYSIQNDLYQYLKEKFFTK